MAKLKFGKKEFETMKGENDTPAVSADVGAECREKGMLILKSSRERFKSKPPSVEIELQKIINYNISTSRLIVVVLELSKTWGFDRPRTSAVRYDLAALLLSP